MLCKAAVAGYCYAIAYTPQLGSRTWCQALLTVSRLPWLDYDVKYYVCYQMLMALGV